MAKFGAKRTWMPKGYPSWDRPVDNIGTVIYTTGMADLLHEYWVNDEGGSFGPVRKENDDLRPVLMPGARCIFSLRGSSWHRAMQMYNERLGYGDYRPAEGVVDDDYTDEQAAEQKAYLSTRER